MKCPQPTLKLTGMAVKTPKGDIIEMMADCPTFDKDVRDWCGRYKKVLLWIKDNAGAKQCQIQF